MYLRAMYTVDRGNNLQALRKPWKYKIILKNFFLFKEKLKVYEALPSNDVFFIKISFSWQVLTDFP